MVNAANNSLAKGTSVNIYEQNKDAKNNKIKIGNSLRLRVTEGHP